MQLLPGCYIQLSLEKIKGEKIKNSETNRQYWSKNLRILSILIFFWFLVSFGAGIIFTGWLDRFSIFGIPLGFWFAQQGAIYTFIVIIFIYSYLMQRLDNNQTRKIHENKNKNSI